MSLESENIPHNCPGTQSEDAGKVNACKGCPNQSVCSSGESKEPDLSKIKEKFENIKTIILVMSGKGGVGKSTVSTTLSRIISKNENLQVGLLDVDLCGPSIPQMMNVSDQKIHQSANGWSPIFCEENLCVMSIGFLLESLDDAVIWRAPKKNALIRQFLEEVDWGDEGLDVLVIDTPPGTSDEHISTINFIKPILTPSSGALIVTTPQPLALLDVRKQINFCKRIGIPIIGVIENMNLFTCPKCLKISSIFPNDNDSNPENIGKSSDIIEGIENTETNTTRMCKEMGVSYLLTLPIDVKLRESCDAGESYVEKYPNSVITHKLENLIKQILKQ